MGFYRDVQPTPKGSKASRAFFFFSCNVPRLVERYVRAPPSLTVGSFSYMLEKEKQVEGPSRCSFQLSRLGRKLGRNRFRYDEHDAYIRRRRSHTVRTGSPSNASSAACRRNTWPSKEPIRESSEATLAQTKRTTQNASSRGKTS